MSKDIETLENIKKQEATSEQRVREAEAQAQALVEAAKKDAENILEKAKTDAEAYYGQTIDKTKSDASVMKQKIVFEAKDRAKKVKPAAKAETLRIFERAMKEKFGV